MSATDLKPAFNKNNIPIFYTSDDNYVDMLSVSILSLVDNSSEENNYDIVILEDGINKYSKQILLTILQGKPNISLRFFSVTDFVKKSNSETWKLPQSLSPASYYILFTPLVACNYSKVIYLDCDTLVQTDISNLLRIDIRNHCCAAALDPNCDIAADLNVAKHLCDDLGFKDMSNYVNSGIVVFNIQKINEANIYDKVVDIAHKNKGYFGDQDVLNAAYDGKIFVLDQLWNVFWGLIFEREKMRNLSDSEIEHLLDNAYIIHFAGQKPTQKPNEPYAAKWWMYARRTPFYERLLHKSLTYGFKQIFHDSYCSSIQNSWDNLK
ncbi:glycosyltransferase family 8 protein [Maridesulfovibrio sp.]|uniref:glycosyltransferase family 8 protein n=1 Tax=Maridesulfovibrio sp. TaxID=2795000 RepID=UPI002A187D65|nr:glycosyltransferase family 8 protein [Maridesulfovibrio sp.]